MITIKTKSEVKVTVTVTQKWLLTLCHPNMHPHTKFGIPTSKNIGDMHRTRSGTVRLLYASKSSFGGIKRFLYSTQPSMKFQPPIKDKILKNKNLSCFQIVRCCIIMLINVKQLLAFYPQHIMSWLRNKKINFLVRTLN